MRKRLAALAAWGMERSRAFKRGLLLALALSTAATVLSAPADIARGLAWLQAQVQAQGALAVESRVAAHQQARCETASTLIKLSGSNTQVAALIASLQQPAADAATEDMACWQQMRQLLGQTLLDSDLEARRISQQGYAPFEAFGVATALDTGWALTAQLQSLGDTDKSKAFAWLQSTQRADGSFAAGAGTSVLASAIVLRSVQGEASRNSVAAALATKAAGYLLAQRNAQGHWLGDVATTAVVFEAVHPYTGQDLSIASSVDGYLVSQQQADGSWAGDPYVTAVALRALALMSVTPLDPTLTSSATIRGVITLAASGEPPPGVIVTAQPAAGAARSATTDSQGRYLLQGVTPGSITLSATLAGYQTVTAEVNLQAGTTGIFSPALSAEGARVPAEARIKGKVVAFGTNAALAAVSVQATGAGQAAGATDAQGNFDIGVVPGTNTVTYALAGYSTQIQQVILSGGATADVGTVPLRPARTTSTLRGVVTDLQGQPVAGAAVAVQGGPSTTANAAGAYSLSELSGLQFPVKVAAATYFTRDFVVTVSEPGDVIQNFTLPGLSAAFLSLSDFTLSAQTAGLRKDVTASAVVSNPSASEASALAIAHVVDPQGKRIASPGAVDQAGQGLSTLTLQPGQQRTIFFKWNTGSFSPGSYVIKAELQVPGTMTQDNPGGVVLASIQRDLAITPGASFFGSVTANPRVLRAGTDTPVKLSSLIQNDGNMALPAQDYRLSVIDSKTGQVTHTQTVNGQELRKSELRALAFSDWTPAGGGNFRLELTSASTPGTAVSSTLYVGDAGAASFTVDKSVVPAGTQKVRSTVKITGQSVIEGTINDPLVPLVKAAIIKAVAMADEYAYDHSKASQCFACHVQAQAIVGGERNRKIVQPIDSAKRAELLRSIVAQQSGNGAIYHSGSSHPKVNTTLALWAFSEWHAPAEVDLPRRKAAAFLMNTQGADGSWSSDHQDAWWRTSAPLTALNLKSLSQMRSLAPLKAPRYEFRAAPEFASVPGGNLMRDAAGNYYHADGSKTGRVIQPDGTVRILSLSHPTSWLMPMDSGDLILVSGTQGLHKMTPSGVFSRLTWKWAFSALPSDDRRDVLIGSTWEIARITLSGGESQYRSMPSYVGLMSRDTDNGIIYYQDLSREIRKVPGTSGYELLLTPMPRWVGGVVPHRGGYLVSQTAGLYWINPYGLSTLVSPVVFGTLSLDPSGRALIWDYRDNSIKEAAVADEVVFDPAMDKLAGAIDRAADWLAMPYNIDSNSNIDLAFKLMGLGEARKIYAGAAREAQIAAQMTSVAATLRVRQRADGGWVWKQNTHTVSDSAVTAMVGIGLDYLNPSADSPEVRKAVQLLLDRQGDDGTWRSENGIGATPLMASTWVEIWLPTMLERLGGIDTDLRVTFAPNVTMSNPDRTPTSSVTAADGSTTYLWKLIGVTEASQQVNFDATLIDMQVDEVRPVAQQASLVFKNSFVDGSVTAAITVPTVAVNTNLAHNVASDKPSYTEIDQAVFTAVVTNAGKALRSGQVRFSVFDAAGQLVQTLPLPAAVSVPGGGSATSVATWPIGGVLAGNYQVKAELLSPTGLLYGTATASFTVTASQQQADSTRVLTDRVSYSAAQSVQVNSRAANLTANVVQEDLRAVTVVRNAAGQQVFTQTEAIAQLAPGGQRQYSYGIAASGLAVGSYSASLQLLNAQGAVLSQSTTAFSVLGTDQSGVGLTGQLQAMPSVVLIGQPVALNLAATNNGNTALANVPVTVRIVEPQAGAVVASFSHTVSSWSQGASQNLAWSWTAQGLDGQTLVAVASASIAGRDITLGQANIRLVGVPQLKAEPVQLDFPLVYAGETAAGQTSTVASIGTTTATAVTLSIAGAQPSQFVLPESGCTQTASLPIGATCTLTVSYRPSEAGQHSAEARIGYANGADVVVNLTGQAKPIILTGSVAPEPGEVHIGQPTSLAWSVSNPASVRLTATLTLSLVDGSGQTVASWPIEAAVAANATTAGNQGYTPDITPQTLTVLLAQSVAGSSTILATSTLVVTEIPVKVDRVAEVRREARILVLVSCPQGEGKNDAASPDDAACVQQRSQGIASYLDSLGISNKVVSTQEAFKREMCCGTYNTYWISGGAAKLQPDLVGQLREAIWAGESLVTDGVHDSRNQLLHSVNGIVHQGKLPLLNQNASILEGSIYAQATLSTLGQPLKAELLPPAKAQAWFTQVPGQQPPVPAIVSNRYGQGGSLLFAFDLAGMVSADPQASNTQLREVMGVTVSQSANGTQTLTIGELTALAMSVANQGTRTTAVEVRAGLPAGLVHHSANIEPTGIEQQGSNAGTVTWTISLGSLQSRELIWRVLARQAGVFELPVAFYSVPQRPGETARLLDSRSFTLTVQPPAQLVQDAPVQVQALQPSAANDKSNKTKALDAANLAASLHAQGRWQEAISQWLAASDALITIASADTTAARDAVAKALETSTDALCAAAP